MLMPAMADSNQVLVVEDDSNALSGYLEFLSAAGFDPTGVSNGAEALPIALRHPPAAVVTDITLPGMSGFDLAAALHCDMRTRHVPVIGLTAHWSPDIRARAVDVAMQAILVKPCLPSHLVAELERVLEHAKAGQRFNPPRRPVKMSSISATEKRSTQGNRASAGRR
jgi:CheY-like chemotaxis protein